VTATLLLGRWQEVFDPAVEVDALIVDAPYGERVHKGHRVERPKDAYRRRPINYESWTPGHVGEFVAWWSSRTRGWFVTLTSHDLIPAWEAYLAAAGRYVFAPVPVIDPGSTVRLSGDGPSSYTVHLIAARPRSREFARWGTTSGHYLRAAGDHRSNHVGGKPIGVMRRIVSDYSRPGDTIVDPCAGQATTLLAGMLEGRNAIGSECDPETHALGRAVLEAHDPGRASSGEVLSLFGGGR
jgi:site-specific DNA-methyltransferase (adenine-specific)